MSHAFNELFEKDIDLWYIENTICTKSAVCELLVNISNSLHNLVQQTFFFSPTYGWLFRSSQK